MPKNIDNNRSGLAGEFAVLSRLAQKGFDASLTFGNTKSVDILAVNNKTGEQFQIEVKTASYMKSLYGGKWGKHCFWNVGEKIFDQERKYNKKIFAFVWFPNEEEVAGIVAKQPEDRKPDYAYIFIVPGREVLSYIRDARTKSPGKGVKKNFALRIGFGKDVLDWNHYLNNFSLLTHKGHKKGE
ncbi:MAG: hypothetical protein FWF35_04195 [Elusimicrobia bacterium]|nr:hypothetical protein [Elusimicrobiota bacterium]